MDKVFRTVKAVWWFFAGYAILVIVVLFVLNITIPAAYSAQTKIFITPSSKSAIADVYDAPYTDRAVKTVTLLATGDDTINGIAKTTGVDPSIVRSSFKAANVTGTQIINIIVTNKKSKTVTLIAQAIPETIDNLLKSIQTNTDEKSQIRVSVAEQPGTPAQDNTSKTKTLGEILLLALAIAYGLVCLLDPSDNTVKSGFDVEKINARFLGRFIFNSKIEKKIGRILEDHESMLAEALREIRTNIIFDENNKAKTIAVTSPKGKEGKTYFSTALGLVLIEAGKKVVIIDADFRSSGITRLFAFESKKGLSDYFVDKAKKDEVVQKTSAKNFFIVPNGTISELHLSTLFSHKSFPEFKKYLVDELKIDYIILDSPSVNATSDTSVISKNSDAVILLAESGLTKIAELREAQNSLKRIDANMLGVVISKAKV